MFELMSKAQERGVVMKKYVDEFNQSLTEEIRMQRGVDPKALLASKLGDQKFVDFKVQADKVAGFDPFKFEQNLGLVGDSASITTARNRLIAMYGGGAEGKKGFDQLSKIIDLMKANASYTIGDPSTFVKRRAVLGGMGALAGGVLPFAAATTVGIIPTLAFVFLSRYAGAVLSNPNFVITRHFDLPRERTSIIIFSFINKSINFLKTSSSFDVIITSITVGIYNAKVHHVR
jgi:hypothetical protein